MTDRQVLRRRVLRAAFASVAAWLAPGVMFWAGAREKMSQKEAEYQDSPKDIRMCATCTLFEPPNACKLVEGEISPNGWCKAFALAD
jgi:High potential iron-sulfur protein